MALRTPPTLCRSALSRPARTPRPSSSRRSFHDLQILPGTNRPIIRHGPGGRSSTTGHVATVFGATGFLGRYVVSKLARQGTQVVVPARDWDDGRHLKVTGDLGTVVPMEIDVKNEQMIEEAVRHSDIVYNFIGRDYETKNFSFTDVHVSAASRIARVSAQSGVPRLVHLSHLNASPDSASGLYRSKWEGEQSVTELFPGVTIVRPGPVFGHEDRLINSLAAFPWSWRANGGHTLTRPVHAPDVAQALFDLSQAPALSRGALFTLPGPRLFTHAELLHLFSLYVLPRSSLALGPTPPRVPWLLATRLLERFVWFAGTKLGSDVVRRRWIDDAGTRYEEEDFLVRRDSGEGAYGRRVGAGLDPEEIALSRSVPGLSLEQDVGKDAWWKVGAPPPKGMAWRTWEDLGIDRLDQLEEQMFVYAHRWRAPGVATEPISSGGVKMRQPRYKVIE